MKNVIFRRYFFFLQRSIQKRELAYQKIVESGHLSWCERRAFQKLNGDIDSRRCRIAVDRNVSNLRDLKQMSKRRNMRGLDLEEFLRIVARESCTPLSVGRADLKFLHFDTERKRRALKLSANREWALLT
jgi:hypothetical protein